MKKWGKKSYFRGGGAELEKKGRRHDFIEERGGLCWRWRKKQTRWWGKEELNEGRG